MTAPIAVTTSAATKVVSIAEVASGLETACQNPSPPAFFASQRSAARGRRTTIRRNVEMTPSERAVVALPPASILRLPFAAGAARALTGGSSNCLLDLQHPATGLAVGGEPYVVRLRPATEESVADEEVLVGAAEPRLPRGERRIVEHRLHDRAVAVLREE